MILKYGVSQLPALFRVLHISFHRYIYCCLAINGGEIHIINGVTVRCAVHLRHNTGSRSCACSQTVLSFYYSEKLTEYLELRGTATLPLSGASGLATSPYPASAPCFSSILFLMISLTRLHSSKVVDKQ
uniref:Uncharacterized protein n=1 Tax=Monopterus albus TaxID=43700 RepID=A0A3Q3R494_MONAL